MNLGWGDKIQLTTEDTSITSNWGAESEHLDPCKSQSLDGGWLQEERVGVSQVLSLPRTVLWGSPQCCQPPAPPTTGGMTALVLKGGGRCDFSTPLHAFQLCERNLFFIFDWHFPPISLRTFSLVSRAGQGMFAMLYLELQILSPCVCLPLFSAKYMEQLQGPQQIHHLWGYPCWSIRGRLGN